MPQINLLPWREELRQQQQKTFIQICLLVGLVTLLLVIAIGQLVDHQIDKQQKRIGLIQGQIESLNIEIQEVRALKKKRDQLLNWIEVVQNLQNNRSALVEIMNSIVQATTPQLYLTRLQLKATTLTLEGEAASNRQISTLMRNLTASPILINPTLTAVTASTLNPGFNHFTLQLEQKISPADQGAE